MFKNLDKFDISQSTTWMDFPELGPKAAIELAPATEANSAYYDAFLRLSGQRINRMAKQKHLTAEDAIQSRDNDRQLFPRFVIRGWRCLEGEGGKLDDDGHVPFTRENARKLCVALPNHLMDRLRAEAGAPESFYAEDEIPLPDLDELAGN